MSYTMKLLIASAIVITLIVTSVFVYHKSIHTDKQLDPVTIVIDRNSFHYLSLMDGDSIWWSHGEFIEDSVTGVISMGHETPQDTIWGLKNFKPLVLITDGDTMRYWFGDTVRFQSCEPQLASKWTNATTSSALIRTSTMVIEKPTSGKPAYGIGSKIDFDTLPLTADNPLTASLISDVQLGRLTYRTASDTVIFGGTGMVDTRIVDTIPVIMLVCDTSTRKYQSLNSKTVDIIDWNTWWQFGYKTILVYNNFGPPLFQYLDKNKMPLEKNILVFTTKNR